MLARLHRDPREFRRALANLRKNFSGGATRVPIGELELDRTDQVLRLVIPLRACRGDTASINRMEFGMLALQVQDTMLDLAQKLVADMEPELEHPNAVEALLALGQCQQRLGRYEEARTSNERAVSLATKREDPLQLSLF